MSTGSCDEASNLVRDPSSPPTSGAEGDDVFFASSPPLSSQPGASRADGVKAGHASSPKQSPYKKSKAAKGLGFLIKAREGAKKSRSKSPLSFKSPSSKSKKNTDDDFLEELGVDNAEGEVDDKVKAKSEHWQAFLQMQDRIKQNVLKTQTSIGKLASGRVSPSGRISPGKDKQKEDSSQASSIPFTNLAEQDSASFEAEFEGKLSHPSVEADPEDLALGFDNSDRSNLIALPEFTVSSPSAFQTSSAPESKFNMEQDNFADLLDFGPHHNTPTASLDQAKSSEPAPSGDDFDLLGLCSEPAPPAANHQMSQRSSLNEDLLGLDDFLSHPASRDLSQENLSLSTDWFGGSSTAQSSAQSSLCPSPVQFDLEILQSQGKLVPTDSTAVSDLARSLVDDFLQWGAATSGEPLSKNPFQSDDIGAEDSLKVNAFNPFATIVESDDVNFAPDFLDGFSEKAPSSTVLAQDGGFDPFQAETTLAADGNSASMFTALDPFASLTSSNAVIPPPASLVDPNTSATPAGFDAPPPLKPAQPTAHSRKSSRKASNPFLISDVDFADGDITFDDNFFAKRGIFHAPSKDLDSIWGTSCTSGSGTDFSSASSFPAANPFQDDSFTVANIQSSQSQKQEPEETSLISQPINPFLTASFENIASQAQIQPLAPDNPFAAMVSASPVRTPSPGPNPVQVSLLSAGLNGNVAQDNSLIDVEDLNFDPFSSTKEPTDNLINNQTNSTDLLGNQGGIDGRFGASKSSDSYDDNNVPQAIFKLDIKEKSEAHTTSGPVPMLPPPPKPPKSPQMPQRENPFDKESPPEENFASFAEIEEALKKKQEVEAAEVAAAAEAKEKRARMKSITSEESTPEDEGPLEPLEPFHVEQPRQFWKLMVRQPTKKKLAGNRFWKMTVVRLGVSKDGPVLRLYMEEKDTDPFQELPLQPCYSISDVSMQQYDQFGKIHTVKIQYIFYRERVGIRPERITPSFVRKPKPNMILDHAPQVSELIKLGTLNIDEIISFVWAVEDALMKLECRRDKTLTYNKDEVQAEVWDEYFATVDKEGHVASQKARVRIFFLAFLTGMPACELGISDRRRKGKEVVGRHDIIPVRTEDWIRIEDPEFHHVVDLDTYAKTHNIRFHPLDACQFELVRFRVRPRENRELPLQLRITQVMKNRQFEVRVDLLVTGYHAFSKKCGQFPCEDIEVRIKIPEVWVYYFRYEKRFGYGSLKAMARKPGRIKGLERITMMAQGLLTPALMEASVGSAKYEHLYRSVVWRIPRLPERNHGAYKNHLFVLHLSLGTHDEIPETLEQWGDCSFTMPASTVSKAQVRSISVENPNPPEKWVRYIARYQYRVEIDNLVETESDKDTSE